MRTIPLQNRHGEILYHAIVDDADFDFLNQYVWYPFKSGIKVYASARVLTPYGFHTMFMHKVLCPSLGKVDHKNGNSLDHTRGNLRKCTAQQNVWNRGKRPPAPGSTSSSRFKGVFKFKGLYRAVICKDKKRISLGYFKTEEEAALAYNKAATELFGEFAWLNSVDTQFVPQSVVIDTESG